MSTRTELLQRRLDAERTALDANLKALGTRAYAAVDWQSRARANLLPTLGLAAAAGFLAGMASRSAGQRQGKSNGAASQGARVPNSWQRLMDTILAVTARKAGEVADRAFSTMGDRWLAPSRSERE